MQNPELFQNLISEEKVNFFVKCQEILIKYHPESPFVFTTNKLDDKKAFFKQFYERYQGYTYRNDNICILFNKIRVKDPRDPVKAIKDALWKEPAEDYNAYAIDFVVFSEMAQCLEFCKAQYEERIKFILFGRNNDIKIYETKKLLSKLEHKKFF